MASRTRRVETRLGWLMASEVDNAISEVRLLKRPAVDEATADSSKLLDQLFEELAEYLDGQRMDFTVRWRLDGASEFTQDVLSHLTEVGFGETISYGELASKSGHAGAARAVGNALNRNPLLILVPCHRVIAADGTIGGFGSGLQCKRALHAVEGIRPVARS